MLQFVQHCGSVCAIWQPFIKLTWTPSCLNPCPVSPLCPACVSVPRGKNELASRRTDSHVVMLCIVAWHGLYTLTGYFKRNSYTPAHIFSDASLVFCEIWRLGVLISRFGNPARLASTSDNGIWTFLLPLNGCKMFLKHCWLTVALNPPSNILEMVRLVKSTCGKKV